MAPSGSWPNPDVLSQCFTVVRWFHEQGSSWSGPVPELASQLASYCDTARWFSNDDQLVSFLETNVVMLRELGVEASVRRNIGSPSIVDLKSSAAESTSEAKVSAEPLVVEPILQEPAPPPVPIVAADPLAPSDSASKPADRLYSLLGVPEIEIMLDDFNPEKHEEEPPAPVRGKAKTVSLVVAAGSLIVLTLVVFVFVQTQSAKPKAPAPVTAPAPVAPAVERPPTLEPVQSDEFTKLLQQATTTKDSAVQYEVGLRFSEGRGVQQSNSAAYSWLVLARSNGSLDADSAIQTLTANLSPTELQRARIAVANAFINGTGVQRNYVRAHHWLALAELSGSTEARALKKQLETKMPLWQIQQATAQNATR